MSWDTIALITSMAFNVVSVFVMIFKKHENVKVQPNPLPVKIVEEIEERIRSLFTSREKHDALSLQVDAHTAEIESIWNEMRGEDKAIRRELGVKFDEIIRAIGRLEGVLSGTHRGGRA